MEPVLKRKGFSSRLDKKSTKSPFLTTMSPQHNMYNEGQKIPKDPVKEVANDYKAAIGREYTSGAVIGIWDGFCSWVKDSILKNRAVYVKNLGTFTISEWKVPTGIRRAYVVRKPLFLLSERAAQQYHITKKTFTIQGKIPVVFANFTSASKYTSFNRKVTEKCIHEIVTAFNRLLYEGEDVQFGMGELGQLTIIKKEINFEFRDDFANKVPRESIKSDPSCRRLTLSGPLISNSGVWRGCDLLPKEISENNWTRT